MDDIFDRLGTLFKSMFQDSSDDSFGGTLHSARSSGDPDLDAAFDELNDFLNKDMGESERRERDALRRAQFERDNARRASAQGASAQGAYSQRPGGQGYSGQRPQAAPRPSWPPQGLVNDYKVFDLPFGTKLPEVKSSYKKILKEFHPDRHVGNPDMLKKATEYSAKVNAAYQRVEHYLETGKYEAS